MKKHKYEGPAGEVEIKDPLMVRGAESTWFIVLVTIGFTLWGGYHLFLGDQSVFMGRTLSAPHWELTDNCAACHAPFKGVPNQNCIVCHTREVHDSIHDTLFDKEPCYSCHPEHTDGAYYPAVMGDRLCLDCHRELSPGPGLALVRPPDEDPDATYVPIAEIFRHDQHWTKRECYECHCIGQGTINVPTRDLLKMESCLSSNCHDDQRDNCSYCHARYHQKRVKGSRIVYCLNDSPAMENLRNRRIRIYCRPGAVREPGSGDLKICGTEIFVDPYRRSEEPKADPAADEPTETMEENP